MAIGTYNGSGTYNDLDDLYDGTPITGLYEPQPYQVQVFAFADTTTFGVGSLVASLENVKNIGWSDYANDVPEAFFTINQDDAKISGLADYVGKAHIRVLRGDRIVFAGLLLESDEADDDAVFYAYGYLAVLYWLLTDWDQEFENSTIATIVHALWQRAKTTLTQTNVAFVTTGGVDEPSTASGGSVPIILPSYPAFYKRILFGLQELAALALSDTTNTVVFEITHSVQPTFHFLKNKGSLRPRSRLTYGGQINSFQRRRTPVHHRNDVKAVGADPHDAVLRKEPVDAADVTVWGRRQEPLFLSWVRDETELDRISKLRLKQAKREDVSLWVGLKANSVIPPGGAGALFGMADSIPVQINRGVTLIDDNFMVVGWQVLVTQNGHEHVRLMLAETR